MRRLRQRAVRAPDRLFTAHNALANTPSLSSPQASHAYALSCLKKFYPDYDWGALNEAGHYRRPEGAPAESLINKELTTKASEGALKYYEYRFGRTRPVHICDLVSCRARPRQQGTSGAVLRPAAGARSPSPPRTREA